MDISVIVPCFNEEESIGLLLQRLNSVMKDCREYELIIIDDGSSDNTWQVLSGLKGSNKNIKPCRLARHYGKEAALYAGFKLAKGDVIVTIDADLQNFPEDIPVLLDRLKQSDAVIGWRRKRIDTAFRKFASYIANALRKRILRDALHDAGCGLRAFKKECLIGIGEYKLFDVFLMSILKSKGHIVEEVEVRHAPRRFGRSKFNIRNRLLTNALALLAVCWLKRNILSGIAIINPASD